MNNAITMLIFNQTPAQFDLTKRAVESALAQDIPIDLFLVDNGSTDAKTWEWMRALQLSRDNVFVEHHDTNLSPTLLANWWAEELFHRRYYSHILGIPNDVILRPDTYSQMLKWPRGIVTASMTFDPGCDINASHEPVAVSECTPLAVVLLRRWVYDALISKDGYFYDPRYTFYCTDCDFALRIASCGIRGIQLSLPYYHYGSASHKLAPPSFAQAASVEANKDRARFVEKWGFKVDALEYGALAGDINFKGEGNASRS